MNGQWQGGYAGSITIKSGASFGEFFATRKESDDAMSRRAAAIISSVEVLHQCMTSVPRGGTTPVVDVAVCERQHKESMRMFDARQAPISVRSSNAPPNAETGQRIELSARAWPLDDEIELRGEEATVATCTIQVTN